VEFADAGCLCRLETQHHERRLLIEAFFRFDSPDIRAVKRLSSLCFFLDLIDQSAGAPLQREQQVRSSMYFWAYGPDLAYTPEGLIGEVACRWRAFQLRQYYVYAIECFWSVFLHRINGERWRADEYLAWLVTEMHLGELAEEYGLSITTADPETLLLVDLFDAIRQALPDHALNDGQAALSTPLNEDALYDQIRSEHRDHSAMSMAGRALILCALLYWRSRQWRDLPGGRYSAAHFGEDRLPLDGFHRHVAHAIDEGWTVAEWLGWFHQRYLWLQHRHVSLEKLISRKQEVAKFRIVEDTPAELSARSGRAAQVFLGTGVDEPKLNAPRFPSALRILGDLTLIEDLEGSGYRLTKEGEVLLARFRNYEIPEIKKLELDEDPEHDRED
jgi:hypothetical protein